LPDICGVISHHPPRVAGAPQTFDIITFDYPTFTCDVKWPSMSVCVSLKCHCCKVHWCAGDRSFWRSSPYTLGAYCHIPVGSTVDDIQTLADPVTDSSGRVRYLFLFIVA